MAASSTSGDSRERRPVALLLAALLWTVYGAMHHELQFGARMGGPARIPYALGNFLYIAPQESNFWFGHTLVAMPAAALTAWGLVPRLKGATTRLRSRLFDGRVDRREGQAMLLAYGVLLLLIARLGHEMLLLGLPLTDDEYAVGFGGRIWASGRLMVPLRDPPGAFTSLFVFVKDGQVASMDFPGVLWPSALGALTGLGATVHALLAAGAGVAVVAACHRIWGMRGAVTAATVWLCAPMVWSLSMTTHGHLSSRFFVALALYFAAGLRTAVRADATRKTWLGLGLAAGMGFCARPAEVGLLLAPFGLWMFVHAVRERGPTGRGVGWALLGVGLPLLAFAAYNAAMTGDPLIPARVVPAEGTTSILEERTTWGRAGLNLGFNLVLLGIFFLGPLGVVLVLLGITGGRESGQPFAKALAAGLALHLLLALAHDNVGVHCVGPIHYSDAAPVLVVLAVRGVLGLGSWCREALGARADGLFVTAAMAVVIGYAAFAFTHGRSLHRSSESLDAPRQAVEREGIRHALVVAPPPVWRLDYQRDRYGSWVLQHPPPGPDYDDDILWAYPSVPMPAFAERFPDRSIYELGYYPDGRVEVRLVVKR